MVRVRYTRREFTTVQLMVSRLLPQLLPALDKGQ